MILWFLMILWFPTVSWANGQIVNIYSSRIEKLIKPAFDAFTKKTGIKVEYLTANEAELIERLRAEGKYTKADIYAADTYIYIYMLYIFVNTCIHAHT